MKTLRVQFVPAVVLLVSFFFAIRAHGQITPSGDSYTNSAAPTTNYGSKTLLDVDAASQITYIQFDLGSIPSGANVSQATLKLFVNSVTTAGSFNVDYVTGSWSEGTIDFSNAPPLGTTIAGSVEVTAAEKNHYILINVTPALVAWLNGSEANNGIALVANGSFNATFDSKENTTTSHAAELDVVFAGGGGGGITGVLTGAGSGLVGGGTSGTLNLSLLNTCGANQVLQWNGSGWGCASVGTGTITGVTAGTDLTGGGSNGNVTLNLDTTRVPQLAAANTFTASQTVNGNLSATGVVTGSSYQIGSNLFAFGSYANTNAFLGFAGNTTMTGGGNTASGWEALLSNQSGNFNTASGEEALSSNTTGGFNTASGAFALVKNTTGNDNTTSGFAALDANTTGSDNTATGFQALIHNTGGCCNTASGSNALFSNTTGTGNAAQGYQALYFVSGSNNTGLGTYAGNPTNSQLTTGSGNTYIGYQANSGTQLALNNATAIGANAEVDASNAMVLGSINGVNGATASTNVGIGTTTPASTLDVHGTGNFTGLVTFAPNQTFPGVGTVTSVGSGAGLTGGPITGSGTLSIASGGVSNAMLANSSLTINPGTGITGGGPVSLGGTATINIDTSKVPLLAAANTFTGNQTVNGNLSASGVVTGAAYDIGSTLFAWGSTSRQNVILGFAGNSTMTGLQNTASGFDALLSNSAGSSNTATGDQSLVLNNAGSFNTATGIYALQSNTGDGSGNGSYNTASGAAALASNTTGSYNTGDGAQTLYFNDTGNYNTALGYQALYNSGLIGTTGVGAMAGLTQGGGGNYSTFVGYNTNTGKWALSNGTAIGANAQVTESNAMVLGSINGVNGATGDTYVGIGTTAPQAFLQVNHTVPTGGADLVEVTSGGSTDVASLLVQNTSGGGLRLRVGAGTGSGYIASSGTLALIAGDSGAPSFPNGPVMTMDSSGNVNVPGNLHVNGSLSKNGGSFQIDHPLDPANKYLYHSFVESPDMMNIYNGEVRLDARGSAWITLPSYFEALNRDFRYQLTSIGRPQPNLYIAEKITGNRFRISGGKAGGEVSWQVTGIRHDAYADAHRIPVEEEKTMAERGRYLHPELFGAARELAIGAANSAPIDLGSAAAVESGGQLH